MKIVRIFSDAFMNFHISQRASLSLAYFDKPLNCLLDSGQRLWVKVTLQTELHCEVYAVS